jgi:hypothetical protein
MQIEEEFVLMKRNRMSLINGGYVIGYLKEAVDEVIKSEEELCEMVEQSEICKRVQNGVLEKSLSRASQDYIKQVLILLLDYFSHISDLSNTTVRRDFILRKLTTPPFLDYLYSNQFFLSQAQTTLTRAFYDSITRHLDTLRNIHIGIFSGLQAVMIVITVYFFGYMFNRMKRDMLSSHLMIAMLPKVELDREEQVKIRDFLKE